MKKSVHQRRKIRLAARVVEQESKAIAQARRESLAAIQRFRPQAAGVLVSALPRPEQTKSRARLIKK